MCIRDSLKVEHLTVKNKEGVKMLDDVSFSAMGGEILGIAGIAGSGQKELLEAISGLQKLEEGSKITYIEPDGSECLLNGMDPLDIIRKGLLLSFVPEDRFGMGLVGGMNIIQNIMLRTYRRGKGPITDRKFPRDLSQKMCIRDRSTIPSPAPKSCSRAMRARSAVSRATRGCRSSSR